MPPIFYRSQAQAQKDWTMCHRKKKFDTLAAAKRGSGKGYRCPVCGKFHSSSKKKKGSK